MSASFHHSWKNSRSFKTTNFVAVRVNEMMQASDLWSKERENPAVVPSDRHQWATPSLYVNMACSPSRYYLTLRLSTLLLSLWCCGTRVNALSEEKMSGDKGYPLFPRTPGFVSPVAQTANCFLYVWAALRNIWVWHFATSLGVPISCRSEFQHPWPAPGHALYPTHVPPSIVPRWSQPAGTLLSAVAKVDNDQRESWEDNKSY